MMRKVVLSFLLLLPFLTLTTLPGLAAEPALEVWANDGFEPLAPIPEDGVAHVSLCGHCGMGSTASITVSIPAFPKGMSCEDGWYKSGFDLSYQQDVSTDEGDQSHFDLVLTGEVKNATGTRRACVYQAAPVSWQDLTFFRDFEVLIHPGRVMYFQAEGTLKFEIRSRVFINGHPSTGDSLEDGRRFVERIAFDPRE